MKKLFAMFMALAICLSMIPAAFAASPDDAVIDVDRLCSIDLYKYLIQYRPYMDLLSVIKPAKDHHCRGNDQRCLPNGYTDRLCHPLP